MQYAARKIPLQAQLSACGKINSRYSKGMKTAFDIIEKIGRPRIKAGLDVDDRIIREWARRGRLPASWFDFCEKATGKKLDRSIFNFKGRL